MLIPTFIFSRTTLPKKTTLAIITSLFAVTTLAIRPAQGAEALSGDFSGTVELKSNYIYRGITQSNSGPAISGSFDYSSDFFYAGLWGSSVEWTDTSVEIDYYAGITPSLGAFELDLALLYYSYPDAPANPEQNFYEIYTAASTTLAGIVEASASIAVSPEFYGQSGQAFYPALDLSIPLGEIFSVGAHYGYQAFVDNMQNEYSDFNISVTASYQGFDVKLGFSNTSDRLANNDDATMFVSLGRSY